MSLLNYDQVSELLGVVKPTLYSMVSRGQVPCIRLSGKLVRFDEGEIRDWLGAHRVPVSKIDRAATEITAD